MSKLLHLLNMIFNQGLSATRILYFKVIGVNVSIYSTIESGCKINGNVTIERGAHLGKDVIIHGNVKVGKRSYIQRNIEISGNVDIGENTVVGSYSFLSTMPEGSLSIGNDVLINRFSVIGASERTEIDDHCIFAAYVQITDASHDFEDLHILIKHAKFLTESVKINKNVWLGSGAMVMKGVTIGEGCVIGAKSLVNHDIPPYSIAFGTPAKVFRKRNEGKKDNIIYENK